MEALKESKRVGIWNDDDLERGEQGVKEDITRIEEQMKEGFGAVDKRFEKVEEEMTDGFAKVDARFEKVEGEMKAGFKMVDERFQKTPAREEMNEGFAGLRSDFAALNRILIGSAFGISGTLIAAVITLVVTHAA
jgi:hypothetical protein